MTKEELEKEATVYALEWGDKTDGTYACYRDAYIASAEPREKRIAELIALINAERKRQEECDDVHLRKIKDLETENAELKKWQKDTIKARGNDYMDWSRMKDQLAKAKELLEKLLITSCNSDVLNLLSNCSEVLRVRVEAEQFLKED